MSADTHIRRIKGDFYKYSLNTSAAERKNSSEVYLGGGGAGKAFPLAIIPSPRTSSLMST